MLLPLIAALAIPTASAACDVKGLQAQFADTSPAGSGKVYAELAACDPTAAKAMAPAAFQKVIAGDNGNAALLAGVKVGAGDIARTWIAGLASDERSSTLAWLGNQCTEAAVPGFFIDTEKSLGQKFYDDRWFAALGSCRDPQVQSMLAAAVDRARKDRAMFGAVLGTYARNLGKAAIPGIADLLAKETDPLVMIDLLKALPDAAGVGSESGPTPDAVTLAISSLQPIAPKLPEKAADAARVVYRALGDDQAADSLAAVRYRSILQPSGGLLYGVIAVETATCKKGDVRIEAHQAQATDTGHTWPDELMERADPASRAIFELDLAASCKGTSEIKFFVPSEPLKDAGAYKTWADQTLAKVQKDANGVSVKVYASYAPIGL
jgi:hypothetical protein